MSSLSFLIERLRDTEAQIEMVKGAIVSHPEDVDLRFSLTTLEGVRDDFTSQLAGAAEREMVSLCDYRIFDDFRDRVGLDTFTSALGSFQKAFSLLYESLLRGPKATAHLSANVVSHTSLGFGFAYTGSLGVVLTLPRQELLFDEEHLLDRAMNSLLALANAKSSDEIAEIARSVGPAPIRAIYEWAGAHVSSGTGFELAWREGTPEQVEINLNTAQLSDLRHAISETSDTKSETVEIVGELIGAHVGTRRFWLESDDGRIWSGTMDEIVVADRALTLPARYRATIRKTTKISYATEAEQSSLELLALSPVVV